MATKTDSRLCIDKETHQKAKVAAAVLGIELNEFVRYAVETAAESANRAQLRTGSADN